MEQKLSTEHIKKDKCHLSVIIPVYNAEATLERCLNSILTQTFRDFEILLIDDGSVDRSPILCDEYEKKDDRVIVYHINNVGPYQARKLGAQKASGKVLTFSDADDWIESNAFETAVHIYDYFHLDILAYAYMYGNGYVDRYLECNKLYCKEEIKNEIIPVMMYDSSVGIGRLNPSLCCKFIDKKLFLKVAETVTERISFGDDALVTYPAVCMAEKIFVSDKVLYHYCENEFSCTHTFPVERVVEVRAFQNNIMRLFSDLGLQDDLEYQVESYLRMFLSMMVNNWYGIELSPTSYRFPCNLIPMGSNVLIYGAGNVGKSYINELKITGYAEIAGWADKKYEKIKKYNNICVIAPEKIIERKFDVLLIAIADEKTAHTIMEELIHMGISKRDLFWVKPIRVI